ncbi:MAG: MBL fold metallo-hydrolase [Chitinophagaceae bacterium]|nr:MBL fold metallo-hydrolase [Chitinophagaceae bacterium]
MKISFHGAARTVTGSKHLLNINGRHILLDCGMFQGMGKDTIGLNSYWGFEPKNINYVIISHAHIDHIGLLPKLVKDGYSGKIICTPATASLAKLLLIDSARIQESDVKYINKQRERQGREQVEPLYDEDDAAKVFSLLETVPYGEHYKVDEGIELFYTDCGHIIGSAAISLRIIENGKEINLTFSGDLGRYRDMILRSPQNFPPADFIIMESTYGNKLHEPVASSNDKLLQQIRHTCQEKRGKLILPAFSLGRTQELLYMLNRMEIENRLPPINYYVDSPLSINITDTVKKYPDYFNADVQEMLKKDMDVFSFKGLKYIDTVEESKALNTLEDPCVIISSSGMAEAGRVKHHIANNVGDEKNTIMMTGYCEPGSLGGRLKTRPASVNIFGKQFAVRAEIVEISSLSAHGDYNDMLHWLSSEQKDKLQKLFLVHGEYDVQQDFRQRLIENGYNNVFIPEMHAEIAC